MSVISTNLVKDIVFTLTVDALQNYFMDCAGMSIVIRVIFIQYKNDGHDNKVSLNSFQVIPFARFGLSAGYPCIIWFSILDTKENLLKALNDAWQHQDMMKPITFQLCMETHSIFSTISKLATLFM